MNEFWRKFWGCRDTGFIVSASIAGAAGYILIGLWALQTKNPFALVLDLLGIASADAAYRVMGAESAPGSASIAIAVFSWIAPVLAVAVMVFTPYPGGGAK